MLLLEIGGFAVSVVTLLLQRLDKHREEIRESPDLQAALLALSESLGRWAKAAEATNEDLEHRVVLKQFHPTGASQRPRADEVMAWLWEEGTPDRASPQAVLAAYAPELREQLSQVSATREEQLKAIEQATGARKPTKSYLAELTSSAEALNRAKHDLDAFIRETFPLSSLPPES